MHASFLKTMFKYGAVVQERTFVSADSVSDEDNSAINYPEEFLNTLAPSGIPPHELKLKVGCPIMLLRNMSGFKGLANGTRLIVTAFTSPRLIEAEIVTGSHVGKRVWLPRIELSPSDSDMPFMLKRRQFPIRPAFAMTINKSQGQTLQSVGVYLRESVFSHGQLYVAWSRVGSPKHIKFMVLNGRRPGHAGLFTRNVVYQEMLC